MTLTTKTNFFETKEQYLAFRQSWKNFINSGNHKKYKVRHTYDDGYHWESDLKCIHHVIYAVIRGKDISTLFTVPTHPDKKRYQKLNDVLYQLQQISNSFPLTYSYQYAKYESLRRPFGDLLTPELIKTVYESLKSMKIS